MIFFLVCFLVYSFIHSFIERASRREAKSDRKKMKKAGGAEKKRVRRSSGAIQNGGRDSNSDTPPRVCSFSLSLIPDLGFYMYQRGNLILCESISVMYDFYCLQFSLFLNVLFRCWAKWKFWRWCFWLFGIWEIRKYMNWDMQWRPIWGNRSSLVLGTASIILNLLQVVRFCMNSWSVGLWKLECDPSFLFYWPLWLSGRTWVWQNVYPAVGNRMWCI